MTPPASAAATRPVRHARRISGPSVVAARGGAVALPAPGRARRRPARSGRGAATAAPGLALRAARLLDGASRSAFLDRLIRGRMWIGVLAFALIGLVAMQLVVLKLNNQIGRTLAREMVVQRENAQLGIEGSETSSGNLVEPQAAAAGMTFAAPGSLHFLTSAGVSRQIRQATVALSHPIEPASTAEGAAAEASTEGAAAVQSATTGEQAPEG